MHEADLCKQQMDATSLTLGRRVYEALFSPAGAESVSPVKRGDEPVG